MKTLEEAATERGISLDGDGLRLHFHSLPNWYGSYSGFKCPRCESVIRWKWNGDLPGFTSPETIAESGVTPSITGGELVQWGHRYIKIKCAKCQTQLLAENFD